MALLPQHAWQNNIGVHYLICCYSNSLWKIWKNSQNTKNLDDKYVVLLPLCCKTGQPKEILFTVPYSPYFDKKVYVETK